jgi:hypothetical protein
MIGDFRFLNKNGNGRLHEDTGNVSDQDSVDDIVAGGTIEEAVSRSSSSYGPIVDSDRPLSSSTSYVVTIMVQKLSSRGAFVQPTFQQMMQKRPRTIASITP